MRNLLYDLYARRVAAQIPPDKVPRHVGIMLDGNRRWARATGSHPTVGHQAGADKIEEFLGWCEDAGVEVVTLWLLSPENLQRPQDEIAPASSLERAARSACRDLSARKKR